MYGGRDQTTRYCFRIYYASEFELCCIFDCYYGNRLALAIRSSAPECLTIIPPPPHSSIEISSPGNRASSSIWPRVYAVQVEKVHSHDFVDPIMDDGLDYRQAGYFTFFTRKMRSTAMLLPNRNPSGQKEGKKRLTLAYFG